MTNIKNSKEERYLAPSVLSADFAMLKPQLDSVAEAGANWLHLDVMDGQFVPNLTIGPFIVEAIKRVSHLSLDCHLMIWHPENHIDAFAKAGASTITVHQEATVHLDRLINQIKSLGIRAGVSLNPATPIEVLNLILPQVDQVLIMSVNPGFGGQKFLPYTLDKIKSLREKINQLGLEVDIEVDGGIGPSNVTEVIQAGANAIVAGSSIFGTINPGQACREMKKLISDA